MLRIAALKSIGPWLSHLLFKTLESYIDLLSLDWCFSYLNSVQLHSVKGHLYVKKFLLVH